MELSRTRDRIASPAFVDNVIFGMGLTQIGHDSWTWRLGLLMLWKAN